MRQEKLSLLAAVLFVFLAVFVVILVLELGNYIVETAKEYNVTCFLNK
jgi:hypothetical protein